MRVIAGSKRSLPLKTLPGDDTRPTNDRIKETLFNMISPRLPDCRFLDLFAGSGQIGIEALSRGAKQAVFVDSSSKCTAIIKDNLAFTRLEEEAGVVTRDVFLFFKEASSGGMKQSAAPFDIIFMDPPYRQKREGEALKLINENGLLAPGGIIIIEADIKRDPSFAEGTGYEIYKVKKYKTNQHIFLN